MHKGYVLPHTLCYQVELAQVDSAASVCIYLQGLDLYLVYYEWLKTNHAIANLSRTNQCHQNLSQAHDLDIGVATVLNKEAYSFVGRDIPGVQRCCSS